MANRAVARSVAQAPEMDEPPDDSQDRSQQLPERVRQASAAQPFCVRMSSGDGHNDRHSCIGEPGQKSFPVGLLQTPGQEPPMHTMLGSVMHVRPAAHAAPMVPVVSSKLPQLAPSRPTVVLLQTAVQWPQQTPLSQSPLGSPPPSSLRHAQQPSCSATGQEVWVTAYLGTNVWSSQPRGSRA